MEKQDYVVAQPNAERPISVGEWVLSLLITALPIINIIMLFVWGFGSNTPVSKANWAKAMLIWTAIGIALVIVSFLIVGSFFGWEH